MNDLLIPTLIAALAMVGAGLVALHWVRRIRRARAEQRRAQGYGLIHALRAYSAWIEYQRDLPFTARSLDELTSPEPLTRAREIRREWFPTLSQHMVRLLQTHIRMIEYLWQQDLLRLNGGSAWRPAYLDPQYQRLRGAQEELMDEMIDLCGELIGDSDEGWDDTGSDFALGSSTSVGMPSQGPAGRA